MDEAESERRARRAPQTFSHRFHHVWKKWRDVSKEKKTNYRNVFIHSLPFCPTPIRQLQMNSIELQYSSDEIRPQLDRSVDKSRIIQSRLIVKVPERGSDELPGQTHWR